MPRKRKNVETAKEKRTRRKPEEVRALLKEITDLRQGGLTIKGALAQLNIPYSNYNYWARKYSKELSVSGSRRRAGRDGRPKAARSSVEVLQEMMENREERQRLVEAQRRIEELDAQFNQLRKKLGA